MKKLVLVSALVLSMAVVSIAQTPAPAKKEVVKKEAAAPEVKKDAKAAPVVKKGAKKATMKKVEATPAAPAPAKK
jgi:hypothetical protein